MKLPRFLKNILTSKYFLYFIAFLSLTNVLGYIMMGKNNTAILFILIAFILSRYTKNMVLVLGVPLAIINFFMAGKYVKEGLDNMKGKRKDASGNSISDTTTTTTTTETTEETSEETKEVDKDIDQAKEKIQQIQSNQQAIKDKLSALKADVEAKKSGTTTESTTTPESFEVGRKGRKGASRIDYGTTIENAYDDLNSILGSDGINKLTQDTQKLMGQQMKLAEAMNNMGPLIQSAKDMLKGFDMSSLSNMVKPVQ